MPSRLSDPPTDDTFTEPVFGMVARFPLGTYRGRRDGSLEPWPTNLRLFEALTHAAGKGSTARVVDGELRPDDASVATLTWLEEHPPTALHVPTFVTSSPTTATYRHEGVLDKQGSGVGDRKTLRPTQASALNGPVAWLWAEEPPSEVRQCLADLVSDVAYLGEAECPAVVEVVDRESLRHADGLTPTHVLVETGQLGGAVRGGEHVPTAVHGRFAALERAYADRYPRRHPSVAQDKFTVDQRPGSPAPPTEGTDGRIYEAVDATRPVTTSPWARVAFLQVKAEGEIVDPAPAERTPWAVAMHRALVKQPALQLTATPLVTGRYPQVTGALTGPNPDEIRRHTNRVAIQVLPPGVAIDGEVTSTMTFAVMIPPDATDDEMGLVLQALTQLRSVYTGALGRVEVVRDKVRVASAETAWAPPAAGMSRFWRTSPVAVPETRRQKGSADRWSLEDSCLLSIGFVFKDALISGELERGVVGYERLRDAVRAQGVRVMDLAPVREHPAAYVHKLPPGVVAQPYRATIDLGTLGLATSLVAIGQTRHLGGGLLRPFDVPNDVASEWMGGRR